MARKAIERLLVQFVSVAQRKSISHSGGRQSPFVYQRSGPGGAAWLDVTLPRAVSSLFMVPFALAPLLTLSLSARNVLRLAAKLNSPCNWRTFVQQGAPTAQCKSVLAARPMMAIHKFGTHTHRSAYTA